MNKQIKITVSPGELIDKLTILEIKLIKIKDTKKINMVLKELSGLGKAYKSVLSNNTKEIEKAKDNLLKINMKLWDIENKIRESEAKKDFGNDFVELARMVYMNNDKRSMLKNKINKLLNSDLNDVKEYTEYKKAEK